MKASNTFSRRRMLGGVAAIGAAGAGMAVLGAAPAQAARGTDYGDALELLVRARRELSEGGREPSRLQALRHVNKAIVETRQAMREDNRYRNDRRWSDPRYDRWDDRRFR